MMPAKNYNLHINVEMITVFKRRNNRVYQLSVNVEI